MIQYKDIQQAYTNILNKYLTQGYIINTDSFSGHQGEICKIDLIKDNKILRILLYKDYKGLLDCDKLILQVRQYEKQTTTLWNNQGVLVEQFVFCEYRNIKSQNKIYTQCIDVWNLWNDKHEKRNQLRSKNKHKTITDEKRINVIIKYLKKQKGYKTISKKDIKSISVFNNKTYTVIFYDNKKRFIFSIK